jgi:integrase
MRNMLSTRAAAASTVPPIRNGRKHKDFVFSYRNELKDLEPDRVDTFNNTAWQKARKRAGLQQVRVHDLRHTFAHRLRAAGVQDEDRDALMGHVSGSMSQHYATPTIARLVEEANKVATTRDSLTVLRVVSEQVTQKKKDLERLSI